MIKQPIDSEIHYDALKRSMSLIRYILVFYVCSIIIQNTKIPQATPCSSIAHNVVECCSRHGFEDLSHKVKTQYVHFRLHTNYFLLPWKIPEEISR